MERRIAAAACAFACFFLAAGASSPPPGLRVRLEGGELRISAAGFSFLQGRPLERLLDGASMTYVFTLIVNVDGPDMTPPSAERRFVVSYDLWEERFAVAEVEPPGGSASHLSRAEAEAWCLDRLAAPVPRASPDSTFVLRLECSVADEEERSGDLFSGLTLAGLIDRLSRKAREAPARWVAASGPLRLRDLENVSRK